MGPRLRKAIQPHSWKQWAEGRGKKRARVALARRRGTTDNDEERAAAAETRFSYISLDLACEYPCGKGGWATRSDGVGERAREGERKTRRGMAWGEVMEETRRRINRKRFSRGAHASPGTNGRVRVVSTSLAALGRRRTRTGRGGGGACDAQGRRRTRTPDSKLSTLPHLFFSLSLSLLLFFQTISSDPIWISSPYLH